MIAGDLRRLDAVRERRSASAREYFEQIAPIWDEERSLHAAAGTVEAAILEAVGDRPLGRVLDVGTGTGRMLQFLADRADRAVGLDTSHSMLVGRPRQPRTRRRARAGSCARETSTARRSSVSRSISWSSTRSSTTSTIRLAPSAEAARLVAPGGRLLVVDFAPHRHDFLRAAAHRRLGFTHDQLRDWFDQAGFDCSNDRRRRAACTATTGSPSPSGWRHNRRTVKKIA